MNCEWQSDGIKIEMQAHYACVRLTLFRTEDFKNYSYENFDAIRIQRRFSASFPVKTLQITVPKFGTKEKSGGYSVDSYSRIASTENTKRYLASRFINRNLGHGGESTVLGNATRATATTSKTCILNDEK